MLGRYGTLLCSQRACLSKAVSPEQYGLRDFPAQPSIAGPHKGHSLRTSLPSSPGSWLGLFLGNATSVVFKR